MRVLGYKHIWFDDSPPSSTKRSIEIGSRLSLNEMSQSNSGWAERIPWSYRLLEPILANGHKREQLRAVCQGKLMFTIGAADDRFWPFVFAKEHDQSVCFLLRCGINLFHLYIGAFSIADAQNHLLYDRKVPKSDVSCLVYFAVLVC